MTAAKSVTRPTSTSPIEPPLRAVRATDGEFTNTLWTALLAAQQEYAAIAKTKQGARAKYAPLDAVLDMARPILNANGLVVTQPTVIHDGDVIVQTTFVYAATGEMHSCDYPVGPVTLPHQQLGAALTYGRRYSLLSLLGAQPEDEDDDGATAGNAAGARRPAAKPAAKPAPKASIEAVGIRPAARAFIDKATDLISSALDLASAEQFYADTQKKPGWSELNMAEQGEVYKAIAAQRAALGFADDPPPTDDGWERE